MREAEYMPSPEQSAAPLSVAYGPSLPVEPLKHRDPDDQEDPTLTLSIFLSFISFLRLPPH